MKAVRLAMMAGVSTLAIIASVNLAGCVTAPAGYSLCNEQGDEPGCGDAVNVTVMDSVGE